MIHTLDIENYKCFRQKRIQFGQITVLAGANSAGKSSVIQSLLLSRIVYERLCSVNFAHVKGITAPLNGQYQLSLGNIAEVLSRKAAEDIIRFTFNDETESLVKIELLAGKSEAAYELPLIATIPDHQKFHFHSLFTEQFHYLNAERIGPRLKYEIESMPYLRVGSQGENSLHVLSHQLFHIPDNRTFSSKLLPNLLPQAKEWMNFIVPGVSIDNVILLGKIKTAEISYGESSPPNVGFGVSYVLPIVLSGLVAAEGSMLIVENPEAHLHPSGQSRIGQFLARIAAAGVQVVVETHSEHVINGIRVATLDSPLRPNNALVNFFSRTDDDDKPNVTTIHFTQKGDLDQWPRDFFDQQQQDFARIIRLKSRQQQNDQG